jgi:hypothetical protein
MLLQITSLPRAYLNPFPLIGKVLFLLLSGSDSGKFEILLVGSLARFLVAKQNKKKKKNQTTIQI